MNKQNKAQKNQAIENKAVFSRYAELHSALNTCETKAQLVNTMLSFGLYTNTTPTTTPNKNDLYIQFADKSRLLITAKSLKVYTCEAVASELKVGEYDLVNDGSYRVRRATVKNTVENFQAIVSYFLTDSRNFLPEQK